MATALVSQTALNLPAPEVLKPADTTVYECDRELRSAAKAHRSSLMRIAYYGFRMRLNEGWREFGFAAGSKGEEAYRESLQIPQSTWHKYIRIGQTFHQLSLDELESVKLANLEILTKVAPSIWHDYDWIKEARSKGSKELAELVIQRNQSVGDDREPMVSFVVRIPFLAKKAMETMVEAFRKRHDLASTGQALEMMIADRHDHKPSLVTACYQAHRLIEATSQSLKRRGTYTEEEQRWLGMALEVLFEAHKEAIQGTRSYSNSD